MRSLITLLALVLACPLGAATRTWTSSEGKALEAEYLSSDGTTVKLRRKNDFKIFTMKLAHLSKFDQSWVAEQNEAVMESDGPQLPKEAAALVKEKGTLIFEDDFNREDPDGEEALGEDWNTNSKTRAQGDKQNDLVDGTLVMTISPRADHAISTRHTEEKPFKDLVLSIRMNLPEEGSLKLAYNDRQDKSVWAGHINGVTIRPYSIKLDDERTGRFNMKYREDKTTAEAMEAMAKSAKTFPLKLKTDKWHEVVTVHRGETLTVYIDGKEVASFSSPGFGHETKRDLAFAVPKGAIVDDLKMWAIAE